MFAVYVWGSKTYSSPKGHKKLFFLSLGLLKLAMGLYCNLLPSELYLFIPIQKL